MEEYNLNIEEAISKFFTIKTKNLVLGFKNNNEDLLMMVMKGDSFIKNGWVKESKDIKKRSVILIVKFDESRPESLEDYSRFLKIKALLKFKKIKTKSKFYIHQNFKTKLI